MQATRTCRLTRPVNNGTGELAIDVLSATGVCTSTYYRLRERSEGEYQLDKLVVVKAGKVVEGDWGKTLEAYLCMPAAKLCDCKGRNTAGGCRHVLALAALLKAGKLTPHHDDAECYTVSESRR